MPTLWELFDPAQLNPNCLERAESIVAPQALHLMNDEAQQELAEHFARRLFREAGDQPESQIRQAYLLAFARTPTPSETQLALSLLSRPSLPTHTPSSASKSPQDEKQRGLILLCHALMNAAEFIYIP